MSTMQTEVVWKNEMVFDVALDGHQITVDADEVVGGKDLGPRPKGLLLAALGGCTSMDVKSMLTKMRIPVTAFKVSVSGVLAEEHPKTFTQITVRYDFKGPETMNTERIRRSVNLSEERYCGVAAMLKPVCELKSEIYINDVLFPQWSKESK